MLGSSGCRIRYRRQDIVSAGGSATDCVLLVCEGIRNVSEVLYKFNMMFFFLIKQVDR